MLREFTQDIGRYRKGDVRDYPRGVWSTIAGKRNLDSFSRALELPPEVLLSAVRGGGGLASPKGKKDMKPVDSARSAA